MAGVALADLEALTNWEAAERARTARRRTWVLAAVAAAAVAFLITWRLDPLGLAQVPAAAPEQPEAARILPGMSEVQVRGVLGEPDAVQTGTAHDESFGHWPATAARLLVYRRANTPSLNVYITGKDRVLYVSQFMEFNPVQE